MEGIEADLVTASEINVKKICFFERISAVTPIDRSVCIKTIPKLMENTTGSFCHTFDVFYFWFSSFGVYVWYWCRWGNPV